MERDVELNIQIPKNAEEEFRVFTVVHGGRIVKPKKYMVLVSDNAEGHVCFDNIIAKTTTSYDEACQFVLDTINQMLNSNYSNIDELSNHLINLEDDAGFAPLFDISEIKEN